MSFGFCLSDFAQREARKSSAVESGPPEMASKIPGHDSRSEKSVLASVAALWGYRLDSEDPLAWGADRRAECPRDLLRPGLLSP